MSFVGSTAKGTGSVDWGIISGFSIIDGETFCASSPTTICTNNGFAHGATIPPIQPSSTYDLGTWTFDAAGDYEGVVPVITRTTNGNLANTQHDVRGTFLGRGIPALPLVGFGALTLGLATIGARSLLRKK